MSLREKQIPKRVNINNRWYDVSEGWAGALELSEWMAPTKYIAREPYIHINGLFFVYDTEGNKVGEFHIPNDYGLPSSCSGCVVCLEM